MNWKRSGVFDIRRIFYLGSYVFLAVWGLLFVINVIDADH